MKYNALMQMLIIRITIGVLEKKINKQIQHHEYRNKTRWLLSGRTCCWRWAQVVRVLRPLPGLFSSAMVSAQ